MAEAAFPQRIVLVGFMGSGKSTVGAEVARLLGWSFLDMDRRIEERTGLTVARIFRERGEPAFREEEQRLAGETVGVRHCVVAAGGGAFAVPETREALRSGAVTVWLRCDLETVLARVPSVPPDWTRPLAGSRETMRRLLDERESSYRLADLAVDASAPPGEVARQIVEAVSRGRTGTARRVTEP